MKYQKLLSLLILVFLMNCFAFAQSPRHFKMTAKPSATKVSKGDKFTVQLSFKFEKEWYTYSMKEQLNKEGVGPTPTEIKVDPADLVKNDGKIKSPKPHIKFDEAYEMNIEKYNGSFSFEIPLKAQKDLDFSKNNLQVAVYMQQCNATTCLPPEDFKTKILNEAYIQEVAEELAADTSAANTQTLDNPTQPVQQAAQTPNEPVKSEIQKKLDESKEEGIFSFIWISMAAGAAALLTPCVFPMVPITVSFFTKRREQSRGKGLKDALVYTLSIIATFTSFGLIFSLVFGATGIQQFVANPFVNLAIAAIFLVFAFNLFGAFELQLPTGLINKLNTKSNQGTGLVSVVFMGLTFSLASFSCTGPLVAAALVSAASGEWFYPVISMLSFSTVLALPFFLLALFPAALTSLPRAGGWMNNIKVVLGFIVIASSLKFINNGFEMWDFGISREIFVSIWIACCAFITLYILGLFKTNHDSPVDSVGTMRILFAVFFGMLTFYFIAGLNGKPMGMFESFMPAGEHAIVATTGVGAGSEAEQWLSDYEQALEQAKKQNRAVFIDFSGISCTNCKLMERQQFPKPKIKELMDKMVKLKLITDRRGEPFESNKKFQLEKFGTVELPLYVIVSPDGSTIATKPYTNNEDEFIEFLKKGVK